MAFPTLTRKPTTLEPDGDLKDSALVSEFTAGYTQTRPQYTRTRRIWGISYVDLPDADVATLRTYHDTTLVNGAASFTWTHPKTAITPTVQIIGGIRYKTSADKYGVADVSFTLIEV